MRRSESKIAVVLFLFVAVVLFALDGARVVLTNDEGILLEPAQRVASGARPYVDFFTYMSPGSYWLQAAAFRLFGVSLWTGRLIVVADFALQCALVFWLAARLQSKRAAAMIVCMFAGFQVADPAFVTAQHRWDSATLALAGVCLVVDCVLGDASTWRWIASGVLFGAAAWSTPAMALAGGALMLWLLIHREHRRDLLPLSAGVAGISAAAVAGLAATGSFTGFLKQIVWLQKNYSAVNAMPYGSVIGGYPALFAGAAGFSEVWIRAVLVMCIALPAILPVIGVAGAAAMWKRADSDRRRAIEVLLLAAVAMVLTVFPRADVFHLAFVAALPYVLAGVAVARLAPSRVAYSIGVLMMLLASLFAANDFNGWRMTKTITSGVGAVRASGNEAGDLENLFVQVRPGATLFVHPYMPIAYFLTQARNPTRYSYMNPGMMTDEDERSVLAELQADPPEWLLYLKLSRQEFLRVFPHGDQMDWRFERLESWLDSHYAPVEQPAVNLGGYRLYRRKARPVPLDTVGHLEKARIR
ncbi:MAG TPA: glycosyltransferase family 39 protein [Bryobacteraceae bacterium]|nr:glycosyltransferase family 39 protein [Bryobacteraceae bacterium]